MSASPSDPGATIAHLNAQIEELAARERERLASAYKLPYNPRLADIKSAKLEAYAEVQKLLEAVLRASSGSPSSGVEWQQQLNALERIVNASYTELRPVVERYRDDGTGLHRSFATDEEWALARRVAEWFQNIALAAAPPAPAPKEHLK